MPDNSLPIIFVNLAMDPGQDSNLKISTEGIATPQGEVLQDILQSYLNQINALKQETSKEPSLNILYNGTRTLTPDKETSIEFELTSEDSIPLVKFKYAIDVSTGKPTNVQHSIICGMTDKKKATLFLNSDKTTLCNVEVYDLSHEREEAIL